MAWGRICEMSVGSNGQGLLVSGLDIQFKVEKSLTIADNFAEFTIYNAKEETRKKILKTGNNIIFKVGYDDETTGIIFVGNIAEASSMKNGVDWETKLFAIGAQGAKGKVKSDYVSLTFSAGTNLSVVISQLASLYNMVTYGLENASIILPNGWHYVGRVSGAFRYIEGILESSNKGMYKDDDEIVVFNKGEPSRITVVNLTYAGGLKTVEDITDLESDERTKYKFTSLIIPQCQLNSAVRISTPSVNGVFTVEKLSFEGDNYGGDFNMTGEVFS